MHISIVSLIHECQEEREEEELLEIHHCVSVVNEQWELCAVSHDQTYYVVYNRKESTVDAHVQHYKLISILFDTVENKAIQFPIYYGCGSACFGKVFFTEWW